ncbi:PX domain-containing protein [Neolecta irregularis DAH-3]|uniref:PX domain-containing protein n=1 Tax=Neolecta irregularis (strain DAH-3) TaxID=1198029 RepID=A0A1U7LS52_NEOID|nr:PX domain-containing protein [Neolecta irregularis DAH-3]|eukprot:OLL25372.1 PX domain-containing protein [Neolecta irregularis DAH-3]
MGNQQADIDRETHLSPVQEHYLKKELLSIQIHEELANRLADPKGLMRFGHPFSSSENISPENTHFPISRYIFNKFIITFPFLRDAKQDEFWQENVQVFIEAFTSKAISASEDRTEITKRRRVGRKMEQLVQLMMNAGIRTASGNEMSIHVDDAETNTSVGELDVIRNIPEGNYINGFDVNVISVRRTPSSNHKIRKKYHAEFLIKTRRPDATEIIVAKRYGAFKLLDKNIREEFSSKRPPSLPKKDKTPFTGRFAKLMLSRNCSSSSLASDSILDSSGSNPTGSENAAIALHREENRLTLRQWLRRLLADPNYSQSRHLLKFLTTDEATLTLSELKDQKLRKALDERRVDEQAKFLEIAKMRARELDKHMTQFKAELIQDHGLVTMFQEIRKHDSIKDLPSHYKKVVEWARIEVAAVIYHMFIAADNSSEVFAQMKRIHSLIPYTILKNTVRFSNPMMMVRGIIDLFTAQPFGGRSLLQRIISSTLNDDIKALKNKADEVKLRIADDVLCKRIECYVDGTREFRERVRESIGFDLLVGILQSDIITPPLQPRHIQMVFEASQAYKEAFDNNNEVKPEARIFSNFTQYLRILMRKRDKEEMISLVQESVLSSLLKDIIVIFYEPLARVYKTANVHNSVIDFANFVDDIIATVEKSNSEGIYTFRVLPLTLQSLRSRHEQDLYSFVHKVHIHDDGLFKDLVEWIELILHFLRNGTAKVDILGLIRDSGADYDKVIKEINEIVDWNGRYKQWKVSRLRQKMGLGQTTFEKSIPKNLFSGNDFGISDSDLADMDTLDHSDSSSEASEEDDVDPIELERKRRQQLKENLGSRDCEPIKTVLVEIPKMSEIFERRLRETLSIEKISSV